MSKCDAYGCTVQSKPGKLMCLKHWNMVPSELQKRVYSTWKNDRLGKTWVDAINDARLAVLAQTHPGHPLNKPKEQRP